LLFGLQISVNFCICSRGQLNPLFTTVTGYLTKRDLSLVSGKTGTLFAFPAVNWYWAICKLLAVTICKWRSYLILFSIYDIISLEIEKRLPTWKVATLIFVYFELLLVRF
jgi:hypothetical protein